MPPWTLEANGRETKTLGKEYLDFPPLPLQCCGSIYISGESSPVNSGDLRYLNVNIDLFIYCLAYRN